MLKVFFILNCLTLSGQVYPGIRNNPRQTINGSKSLYVGQSFGIMFSYGLTTWTGREDGGVAPAVNTFAPTGLDIDQWLDTAVQVGAKYGVFTANWYDGFASWPTKFFNPGWPTYGISGTTWYANNGQPDLLKLFVQKSRERKLGIVVYLNFHYTRWPVETGKTPAGNTLDYENMVLGQVYEILTGYGPIDALWIDGWGWTGYTAYLPYNTVLAFVKNIQPDCLLINNNHTHPGTETEVEVYELVTSGDGTPLVGNTRLSEAAIPLASTKWYYDPTCTIGDLDTFTTFFNARLTRNFAALVDVGIGRDGRIPDCQVTALKAYIAKAYSLQ